MLIQDYFLPIIWSLFLVLLYELVDLDVPMLAVFFAQSEWLVEAQARKS